VLTDDSYPPYSFRSADGRLKGILVDQWLAWERATGRRVDLVGMAWGEAQKRMLTGEADVIDTIFDTPERRQFYSFGPPYAPIDSAVFFPREIGGIAKVEDLRGFRVAVKSGDACIDVFKTAGVTDLVEYPSYEDIIRAAAAGEERIFCIDRPPALYFLYKYSIADRFHSSVAIHGGDFHRAVLKGNENILKEVVEGFAKVPRSTLVGIDNAWMGSALPIGVNLRVLVGVGGAILVLFFLLLLFALLLRRQVARATTELRSRLVDLEASQARNRAFIAALPDIIFIMDRDGRYLECMASSEELLAAPKKELLGRTFAEVLPDAGLAQRLLNGVTTVLRERRLVVIEYDRVVETGSRKFEGRFAPLDEDKVILMVRDITEVRQREDLLRASLAEKEVLLREIHHRVKNNLQVISSIVSLQETSTSDEGERRFGQDTQSRIRAMAQLHEILYGSGNLGSIEPAEYLHALAGELAAGYGVSHVHVEAEAGSLTLDEAMPFGLIANELLSNALKYAYPSGIDGDVFVRYATPEGGPHRLEVEDYGTGLCEGIDPEKAASMGFTLVRTLAAQLKGRLTTGPARPGEERPGFVARLEF
jgi:PAS domain S-box-containing protein